MRSSPHRESHRAGLPTALALGLLACGERPERAPAESWRADPAERAGAARAQGDAERAAYWELVASQRAARVAPTPAPDAEEARALRARGAELLASSEVVIGYQSFDQVRVREACALLERSLALDPRDADGQDLAGYGWFLAQDFDRARARYESALLLDATRPAAWGAIGAILLNEGRAACALEPLSEAVRLAPEDANAHYVLAKCAEELGRAREAEASYRRALELHPGLIEPYNRLASVLLRDGREDEGRRQLELFAWWKEHKKALRGEGPGGPRDAPALELLHARLEAQLAQAPGDARTLVADARVARALALDEHARARLRELRKGGAGPDELVDGAALWARLGEPARAAALLERALEARPDHVEARLALAALARDQGRAQVARGHYEAVVAVAPACGSAREALAALSARAGGGGEAGR